MADSLRVRFKWAVLRFFDSQIQTLITERLMAYHQGEQKRARALVGFHLMEKKWLDDADEWDRKQSRDDLPSHS